MTAPAPPHALCIQELLAKNRIWAESKTSQDSAFFQRLEAHQAPAYLWIGCSDSRVPANEIIGLEPGELFVHRNVGNLAPPQDANYLSVLQYAVEQLKVHHILVVGHYGCGGVLSALKNERLGLIDHWLSPIRELVRLHREELDALPDEKARHDRLCELNVLRQVENVANDPIVTGAWAEGTELIVHGWCYSLATGLVNDLGVAVSSAGTFPG
jgi:carbonic anhydrase